jgi:type VI secretion system secreted protein Hcp
MAIYLKFGKVKGNVTETGHKDWIEVSSVQWGVGRGISTPVGSTANREASAPSVSEVTITKQMDMASTDMFMESVKGNKGEEVKIDIVSTGNPPRVFCTYTLSNALVSGYSVSTGGDRPSESISLNFTKLEFKYTPSTTENSQGTPVTVAFDLSKATTS